MTNIILLIFIEMLNIFLASTIPMNGINDSITKCAEVRHKCNPNLQDPCCNPNRICVNKIRDQLYISDYICLKKGVLNSPCKKSFDCEAIIGAKCSENGRCVCRKQSVAYNETICLQTSINDRLVDELMDYYYDFNKIFYLKINYSSKSGCQIISSTNYGEPCNSDIQCSEDHHSNLKCINKECKCPNETQFTLDTLTCQNSMGGINKPCLVNKKCSIENSYCNPYGMCKCKVNYYYTFNDKCEFDKSRGNCSKEDVFLHTPSRTLYKPAKKPNDPCLSNTDCYDVKHTTCQSRACKCIRNFYVSEKTGNCTRYAKQPNERCIEDKGCRKVDNTKCKSRLCQCDENFPLNLATKKCEFFLGRKCTEDSNCDTTKNVVCSKGKCVCDVNHFEKNYSCVLGINGYCKESGECHVNNSFCQNDRCKCAMNFYASKNKSLCIANAKSLHDYCESNESCQEIENTECSNNKCQCMLKFIDKDGKCRSLDYCEAKVDCQLPKYSVCRNNRCVCSQNRYLSSNNTKCSSYAKSIGSSCEDDKRCARVKNTKCIEKKCACVENYFEDNNKCKGLIDAECSENSDCIANNSLCESNRCKCFENFHPSTDRRECRKYANYVNDLCEDNDDCTKVKNSKCSENDHCVCKMKYFQKDNECKAFIGINCTEDSECGANNSQCDSNECLCSHGFYSSVNKQECIKYAAKPNEPCESDKSCIYVEYSYCSKSNECTCKPNYLLIDDQCRGLIGENCSVDSDCGVKYSTCKSNTCTCPIDYYPSYDQSNCFQYAKKLNDFCETDGACRDVKFTYCSVNRQCTCLMNYTVTNDKCRGLIGTNCSEALDCATENSKCELNACQCLESFRFSLSNQKCYAYSKHLNDYCEIDDDCKNIKYTYCTVNNKCSCLANYIAVDGSCTGLVGEKCSDNNDCAVDNSKCEATICQCKVDFYLSTNKDKCYPFASQVDDFCETDFGCQNLGHTHCFENACTCWPNYTIVDGHCRGLINAKCFVDSDCSIESSICASNTCQCPINFYLSADENQCHSFAKQINDFCESDVGCRELKFSYCSKDNKCTCLLGYIDDDGYCSALIGSICFKSLDCAADNAICDESKTCQCPVDFYLSVNKEECYPYAKKQTDFCETDITCRNLKYTYCSEDYKCVCLQNYIAIDGHCRGYINATCSEESDCAVNNSICDESNTCQCPGNFYLSSNNETCNHYAEKIYDFCDNDSSCRDLQFTFCSADKKCTCLSNYNEIAGDCHALINAFCSKDSECAANNSACESNICQCNIDFYPSSNKAKCYPFAKQLTDFCETDVGCRDLKYTHCSDSNRCVCSPNYTAVNGCCRGFIGSHCSGSSDCASNNSICLSNICQCSVDSYFSTDHGQCHLLAKRIYDSCETDTGCRDLKYTYCSEDSRCTCIENFTIVNGYCLGLIDANCSDDFDCAIDNSICDHSDTCQCPVDRYLSVDRDKCHPYAKHLHDFCENDMSCRGLKFTYCFEGKCTCSMNYMSNNESCLGLIGSACSEDLECAAENSVCDQTNTCQCSVDFNPSLNREKCHQYAKKLDDECETDVGCRHLNFTNCSEDYKCSCLENYTVVRGYCRGLIDAKCSDDFDCAVENSICDKSNTCQCSVGSYLSVHGRKCYAFAKQLNDFCESSNGCRDLKYTYCSEGNSCICSENYIEVDGYCRGLIGMNCSENSDCAIERSICRSSTCKCSNDFYLSESGNQCYQFAKELNTFCESDIGCREFKYTHCSDDNRCACLENYTVVDGNCRGLINAYCFDDLDCAVENSNCKSDTCQCPSNFYLSINKKKCYPYAKQLKDFCENDIGCIDLKHTVCSDSNQCTCSSNYAVIEGHCLGLIGANCSDDLDCGVDKSICESNICQCRYGFYLSENQEKCYAHAKQLDEFCESNIGCSDLKYTICSEKNECVCLRNYTNIEGHCRADIGSNCSEDLDCAVDKSICEVNLCQCPSDYYVSTKKEKCFPYAKQLNEFCEDNVGCQDLKYSHCSKDNQCICAINYIEVSKYCRGLIGANCSGDLDCVVENSSCDDDNTCHCQVDFYLSTNKDKCYPFASQVDDFCETDFGCQNLGHTHCFENACTCWPNYTIVDGHCRGLINAKCFVDSDCSIESSICASNTCQCPINFYLSADENRCHSFAKHINDFCESDVGCRELKFSYCSRDNKCTCLLGYIDDDGYCSALIGSICSKSLDCAADNAICDESKTCQCPVDFYLSVNKEECYPYAKKQTDFCETDITCRNLKYTYCSEDYKCVCLKNYIAIDGHCRGYINATCSEESDCAVNNSICDESNTCQCPGNFYLSSNNETCNHYAENMDDSCEDNYSCRDLKFTYCSENKKCTCLPTYKKLHGECLGLIDAKCFNNSDCAIENSICDSNICKCRIDSYLSVSNNKCQPYANRVDDFCETNNSCRNLNNTYCSKNHKCVCLKNYTLIENYCRGFIGSNCSKDLDCAAENSVCSKSTCQCHDNFYLSANKNKCHLYAERIDNFCEDDAGCRNLEFTYCSKNNKCTCLPNYIQVNDRCRGLINAKCSKDADCALKNSICDESNSCQCLGDFYLSANKGKCHQYAKQLDDFCETDDGCRNLKYAHCSKKNKCICLLNYTEADGRCRGFIGSNCSENLDCLVDYLECKSNVCQCPDNFYFSSSQQQCIPYAKQLKDFCETNKSCRDIKFTYCSENKQCTCLRNYVEEDENCRGLIDEYCFEDSDCKVENSRCNYNICQCSVDYYPSVNNDSCFKYAQNLTDYCEDNEGCRKIKYSFCSVDKNCTCFTPYKENAGQCLGVFNASCFNDTDCDNFYQCSSNRCSCRDNFVFDDYHKCIPVNRYLGDSCIDNEYCRSIEHSSCDLDYHCTCSTNYINVNGSCLHYLGTCCFKDSDCGIKDSICKGYTCKCKKKYFFHPFFIECRKK